MSVEFLPRFCFSIIFVSLVIVVSVESVGMASREYSANVSALLTSLLNPATYDRRIRPDFGGPPVEVMVNMHIKSLGPVYEDESKFSMDIYFRQTWYDRRLAFKMDGLPELVMSWLFLEKIWKPDTYFVNGKKSHLHRITSPNQFVRVRQDGFLIASMRLTLMASCKMHLKKFPLDAQSCPVVIGSYAYTAKDLKYKWDGTNGVKLEAGVGMAQYHVTNITTTDDLLAQRAQGQFSVIMTTFNLKRSTGYYMLQIYVPCFLIVCCSWISFWITPTDSSGRTSLGATTVLSITTLGFAGRSNWPKVSHATALDWYVIICFSFAFMSLAEFAAISFLDKLITDLKKLEEAEEKKEAERKAMEEAFRLALDTEIRHIDDEEENAGMRAPSAQSNYVFLPNRWYSIPTDLSSLSLRNISASVISHSSSRTSSPIPWYTRVILVPLRYYQRRRGDRVKREADKANGVKKEPKEASRLDDIARIVFPSSYFFIIGTYAVLYTYYIQDKEPDDHSVMGFFKVD